LGGQRQCKAASAECLRVSWPESQVKSDRPVKALWGIIRPIFKA
jgi:hypothetical protein